ncbi:HNH endonuclease signature motif containing protein [Streptomyces sp. NPDC048252]
MVVPLSRGGTNDIENLRRVCGSCNFSRGNKTA